MKCGHATLSKWSKMSAAGLFNLLTPQWGDVGCKEPSGQECALRAEDIASAKLCSLRLPYIQHLRHDNFSLFLSLPIHQYLSLNH